MVENNMLRIFEFGEFAIFVDYGTQLSKYDKNIKRMFEIKYTLKLTS